MPHICTRCNNVFGSGEDILKGCPVCGWRKFMFVKNVRHEASQSAEQLINQSMGVKRPPSPKRPMKGQAVKGQGAKEQLMEKHGSGLEKRPLPASPKPARAKIDDGVPKAAARKAAPAQSEAAVRPENEKLESIKITAPGTYELNLPSLFEREELIMAVKEGTYFIDLSSAFRKGSKRE
jgi:predicted  nucleic acid-binding Zn-ribbon protein